MMNVVPASTFSFAHNILRMKCLMKLKLGTHMLGGERRKPIEDRRTKVKVTTSKNRTNI